MADKKHDTLDATEEARKLAHMIAFARRSKKEWDEYEKEAKERLLEIAGNTNVEFKTAAGEVVATIDESETRGTINWKKFQEENPAIDFEAYRGEARTTVTVRTTWIEQGVNTPGKTD
ncbi:MAG: hypothetical protein PHW63_11920 [Alphaproteobacteria bacterium]|nr:hypothetical protein [Alphaproteobacteria bacterium]